MQEIDTDTLATRLADGARLIDVREPAEYVEGHVPGAVLVPMSQLANRVDELETDRPVHLICASGNRSGVMAELLEAKGFEAINVVGGTTAWARSGKPLDQGL